MTVRSHRLALGALAFVTLMSIPVIGHAQVIAPREPAQLQFGPLSLYPSVQIIDAGIDENVFNDADNPKSDMTLTVASRVLAVLRLGLNDLMFSTGSDYLWFKDYAAERSGNQYHAVRFNLSASRFKPYVGAERARTRSRPSAEIDARARRSTNLAIAGTSFSLTERTDIHASTQWDDSKFEAGEAFRGVELGNRLNSKGRTYSGGVRYAVTPFTALSVNGTLREEIFPQSHLRDSKSYGLLPKIEFAPEAAIRGSVSAGYQLFVPDNPALSENRGIVFEGVLNWAIASRTAFDLSLVREINSSYQDTEPYYLQTGARLTVTQHVSGPFSVRGAVDRQHLSYQWTPAGSPSAGETRNDTVDVLIGGVSVRLGRGFSVLVGVENTRRRSPEAVAHNFKRTRFLSTFTLGSE